MNKASEPEDLASYFVPVEGFTPEETAVVQHALSILASRMNVRDVMSSPQITKDYLQLHLAVHDREVFSVMYLDSQNRLIRLIDEFFGTLTQTSVYPREIVKRALQLSAASVVFSHNHPSGSVEPSAADERLTKVLKDALALVDVRVLDHVIVAPGKVLSMAERGRM